MARQRMHRGLVALSATAIAAVYSVGLLHTRPTDAALSAAMSPPAAVQAVDPAVSLAAPTGAPTAPPPAVVAPPSAPTSESGSRLPPSRAQGGAPPGSAGGSPAAQAPAARPTSPPANAPTSAPSSAPASTYKDGTYAGSGTSRFGNVEVAVTVQGGRISNVSLTRVTTKYPASRIAALPGQVVARQSAQVDNVSGATASAQAFRSAVQQALSKAV